MPNKEAAILKIRDRIGRIVEGATSWDDIKDEVSADLDYLWEESLQQAGLSGMQEVLDKLVETWRGDEELQMLALGVLTDEVIEGVEEYVLGSMLKALREWAENYFGEWQGREIVEEAEKDIRRRYAEYGKRVQEAMKEGG